MTHLGAILQPRIDHPPADHALQRAQGEDQDRPRAIAGRDRAPPPEDRQYGEQNGADAARDQPMEKLPEIDVLEAFERHAGVEGAILRNRLVAVERRLPLRVVQGGNRAEDRIPFDDRQAGFGQPRDPADDHDRQHHRRHDEQPYPERARGGAGDGRAAGKTKRCGGSRSDVGHDASLSATRSCGQCRAHCRAAGGPHPSSRRRRDPGEIA